MAKQARPIPDGTIADQESLYKLAARLGDVPGRDEGRRRTPLAEAWVVLRFLATIMPSPASFHFPIWLRNGESPDFSLNVPAGTIGIEVTEAIDEQYSHALGIMEQLAKRTGQPPLGPDPGWFGHGGRFSTARLHELVATGEQSDGWVGSGPERLWAGHVREALDRKIVKVAKPMWHHHDRQVLVIYDNTELPANVGAAIAFLTASLPVAPAHRTFDDVFVLSGGLVVRLPWGERADEPADFYPVPERLVR